MDCDLQDRPEEFPRLLRKVKENFHLVRGLRKVRQDHVLNRQSSIQCNRLFVYLTGTRKDPEIANFGIYFHDVIQAILGIGDRISFTPSLVEWVGFKEAQIDVEHAARESGTYSYSWLRLLSLALYNAVAFSLKPLHLTLRFSYLLAFIALLMTADNVRQKLHGNIEVSEYASIIISIWFLSGVIVSVLGVVGLYVGCACMNTKFRPHFMKQDHPNSPRSRPPSTNRASKAKNSSTSYTWSQQDALLFWLCNRTELLLVQEALASFPRDYLGSVGRRPYLKETGRYSWGIPKQNAYVDIYLLPPTP